MELKDFLVDYVQKHYSTKKSANIYELMKNQDEENYITVFIENKKVYYGNCI